jgi:multimeric flavodoxin WrbA
MKVLMISGSNRHKGNTQHILDLVAKELTDKPLNGQSIEVELLPLGKQQLKICTGCRACFNLGEQKCPLKDDLLPVLAKMQAADLLVVASPVYVSDVSGLLKNWIDRLAFMCHRPALGGKPVYLIATTGQSPTHSTIHTMQGAFITWGAHLFGSASFIMGARMPEEEIVKKYGAKIRKIAAALGCELERLPGARPNLVELIVFQIQAKAWRKAEKETVDFRYWQENGWFDQGAGYFIPYRANFLIKGLTRLISPLVALFVT